MAAFYQATGLVQYHIGHFHVVFCRFVEGRSHNFGLYAALHIRHFFRTLVHQQDDFVNLRVIVCNGVGNGLQEHGLTRFGLSHNEAALALADGGEHIYHADALVFLVSVAQEIEFLRREEGSEEIEGYAVPYKFRRTAVDELDLDQGKILVSFARRTDFSGDGVSVFEGILLDLLLGNVDIVRGIEVIVITGAEEAITVRHNFQDAGSFNRSFEFNPGRFGLRQLGLLILLLSLVLALVLVLISLPAVLALAGLLLLFHLGIVLLEIFKQVVDEFLTVYFTGCGGGFGNHFHGSGSFCGSFILGFAAALSGLLLRLFLLGGRGLGSRLILLGGSGLAAFFGSRCRSGRCCCSFGLLRLLVGLLFFGTTALFGLVGIGFGFCLRLLGGRTGLLVQDFKAQVHQVHLFGPFDIHGFTKASELLFAHRIEFC